jgi:hypothetical protein
MFLRSAAAATSALPRQHPQRRHQDALRLLVAHQPATPALQDGPLLHAPLQANDAFCTRTLPAAARPMADTVHLSLDDAHALALGALAASSFSDDQARAVADTVIAAEHDECTSHGLFRTPFHVKALQNPDVNSAVPELADRAPRAPRGCEVRVRAVAL